jgi:hypothetical protein
MKIIYNKIIPFKGFSAMMLFGVIFARKEYNPLPYLTINHEEIHRAQARDCGGYVWFYLRYARQWMRYGYRNCPFEREAYAHEHKLEYLKYRLKGAWRAYELRVKS